MAQYQGRQVRRTTTITQEAEVTGRSPTQSPSLAAENRGADTRNPAIQAMTEPMLEEIHISVAFFFFSLTRSQVTRDSPGPFHPVQAELVLPILLARPPWCCSDRHGAWCLARRHPLKESFPTLLLLPSPM